MKNSLPQTQKAIRSFIIGAIIVSSFIFQTVRANPANSLCGVPGTLDPGFNGNGVVTTSFAIGYDSAASVAIQADARIVAAGTNCAEPSGLCPSSESRTNFALARYNSDGSLDNSFGIGGKVSTAIDNINSARSVAIQADSRIVAAGRSFDGQQSYFALVRYNNDGTLDTSFGKGGKVTTSFGSGALSAAASVAIQPDGRIVAAGYSYLGHTEFGIARYNTDGTLDTSFGASGTVTTRILSDCEVSAIAIQPDGRIVAVGPSTGGVLHLFALARYSSNGTLDMTFGNQGVVTTQIGPRQDVAYSVAIQRDGRIITAGTSDIGTFNNLDFALVRYNANGSLDSSFGSGGKVTTDVNGASDIAHSIVIQQDGRIVAAGKVNGNAIDEDAAVVRYNQDGSLDRSMNGNGIVITGVGIGNNASYSAAIQRDGRIVTAGSSGTTTSGGDFTLIRYGLDCFTVTPFDYDSDGRADVSVFRPSEGNWYLLGSSYGFTTANWGIATDKLIPADYDGDGKTDIGVYRPTEGNWYVLRSSDGTLFATNFGLSEDIPEPGDFDGDGLADVTVYRPSTGTWHIGRSTGGFISVQFGTNDDRPVVGDFNGDGAADLAVFRPSNGTWYYSTDLVDPSHNFVPVAFGVSTDTVTPADFDGDGRTDIAVYRPSNGSWYWINSSSGMMEAVQFGITEDIPTAADYDGDGRADISVFRPSSGIWYRLNSSNGSFFALQFGTSTDRPTPAAFRY